ncbi:ATP-binding protein [Myxococcus sp. NMCA1]|uniref:ATP-binding protein n=1 Tax=Myxococcus sp. NMCA1 TaxID=2996785 RepID=UPI0022857ABA|nr:ATP-binding protein [Myxococcus sp. NMCA1]WAM25555.1 ATP-binding protein [Myxococcus sp. NMCA1]
MNLVEITRALTTLRLSGIAQAVEGRILQAQAEKLAPLDFLSALVNDELTRRSDGFIQRRLKQGAFRDAGKTLDGFDFDFNMLMVTRKRGFLVMDGEKFESSAARGSAGCRRKVEERSASRWSPGLRAS